MPDSVAFLVAEQPDPSERHTVKRLIPFVSALAVVAAALATAAPASAATLTVSVSARSGTVGVSQTISATVKDSGQDIGGGVGTVTFTANGAQIGTDTVGGQRGTTASINWTPQSASPSVNITATFDDGTSDTTSVSIASVSTSASITTPGSAGTSTQVSLAAQVRAKVGSYVPTGSVTFYTSNGSAIGTSNLDGNGRASIAYTTPATAGTVYMYVIYNGDANATASGKSGSDSIKVTAAASSLSLVAPQTNFVGSPSQLTAKVNPASGTGSVAFSANGSALGSANVANGVATINWVPASTGNFTLKAVYSGGGGVAGATATNGVTVTQPLKADVITLNPAGAAGPWPVGSTQGLANGATVTFGVSSSSGLPVTLAVVGPCSMSGNTLTVNGVGGPCTLTASTPGGNGYAPTTQSYQIVTGVGNQTASVNPAASGVYRVGAKLLLAPTTARTSLGNAINWSVTSGGKSCKIKRTGGNVKVNLVKKGSCQVTGSAPAVPGQWAAFTTGRTYTVR